MVGTTASSSEVAWIKYPGFCSGSVPTFSCGHFGGRCQKHVRGWHSVGTDTNNYYKTDEKRSRKAAPGDKVPALFQG